MIGRACAAAWVLWFLGYPEQALTQSHAARTLAQELSHPFSLVWALLLSATLHQHRREEQLAQERAEAAMLLASEQGSAHELAVGTSVRGWALAEHGKGEEGIAQMRRGLDAQRATGAKMGEPYELALLAEAYGKMGQAEEGLSLLAEALAVVDRTGGRVYEADLHRLKGELTLQKGAGDWGLGTGPPSPQAPNLQPQVSSGAEQEAEEYFLKAIEIAQSQKAKSLELRAATSLAGLRQQQGKRTEAHKVLLEIYHWFTEGFDTKDLQEAKALLDALRP